MIDFKVFWGFAFGRTDGQTFVIVESLSRLKRYNRRFLFIVRGRKNRN